MASPKNYSNLPTESEPIAQTVMSRGNEVRDITDNEKKDFFPRQPERRSREGRICERSEHVRLRRHSESDYEAERPSVSEGAGQASQCSWRAVGMKKSDNDTKSSVWLSKLHIDDGWMGGGGSVTHRDNLDASSYQQLRTGTYGTGNNRGFDTSRNGIFYYCIFAHRDSGGGSTLGEGAPGLYYFVVYDEANKDYANQNWKNHGLTSGCTFIHELGHKIGLSFTNPNINPTDAPGLDSADVSLDEYPSCMNYNSVDLIGYSDGSHGTDDFDDWGHIEPGFAL